MIPIKNILLHHEVCNAGNCIRAKRRKRGLGTHFGKRICPITTASGDDCAELQWCQNGWKNNIIDHVRTSKNGCKHNTLTESGHCKCSTMVLHQQCSKKEQRSVNRYLYSRWNSVSYKLESCLINHKSGRAKLQIQPNSVCWTNGNKYWNPEHSASLATA